MPLFLRLVALRTATADFFVRHRVVPSGHLGSMAMDFLSVCPECDESVYTTQLTKHLNKDHDDRWDTGELIDQSISIHEERTSW